MMPRDDDRRIAIGSGVRTNTSDEPERRGVRFLDRGSSSVTTNEIIGGRPIFMGFLLSAIG